MFSCAAIIEYHRTKTACFRGKGSALFFMELKNTMRRMHHEVAAEISPLQEKILDIFSTRR